MYSLLDNRATIGALGVSLKDLRVLKNLLQIDEELDANFKFIDSQDFQNIDILFLNVDDEEAMTRYHRLKIEIDCQPIFVVDGRTDKAIQMHMDINKNNLLQLPFRRSKLNLTLKTVVSTEDVSQNLISSQSLHVVRALVVDESFAVRKNIEKKLTILLREIDTSLELNTFFASSGKEAIDRLRVSKGCLDVVFLDVVMRDMDGYKLCNWIKSATQIIHVAMLSNARSPFDKARSRISGCDSFVRKPVLDETLRSVLVKLRKVDDLAYA